MFAPLYLMVCMIWCLSSLPLQIGVALYLLYTQVNYAFLSGLAITIILIPGIASFLVVYCELVFCICQEICQVMHDIFLMLCVDYSSVSYFFHVSSSRVY